MKLLVPLTQRANTTSRYNVHEFCVNTGVSSSRVQTIFTHAFKIYLGSYAGNSTWIKGKKNRHRHCTQVTIKKLWIYDFLLGQNTTYWNITMTFFRLSTIRAADRIIVMDTGRIVEVCHILYPSYILFLGYQLPYMLLDCTLSTQ